VVLNLENLQNIRAELVRASASISTVAAFLQIQERAVQYIRRIEELSESESCEVDYKAAGQIRKFRLIVDGLAWSVLHPHVIRQHAKVSGRPPTISSQGAAFDAVLRSARQWTVESNAPVLICDATNILRLGDLVVCADPEEPTVVECKMTLPRPQHLTQGRRGRQLSRALGTSHYLAHGQGRVLGDTCIRLEISSEHRAKRNWQVINELCAECVDSGMARRQLSDHETLWAFRPSEVGQAPALIDHNTLQSSAYFGTTGGLMNMDDGLFAPPGIWPIDIEHRIDILEGKTVVAHCVCTDAFESSAHQGMPIRVQTDADRPINVVYEGKVYPLSLRFVYDVLYGYETVESCVHGISDWVIQLAGIDAGRLVPEHESKPKVTHVADTDDAVSLLSAIPPPDYVSISKELMAMLASGRKPDVALNADAISARPSAYCILEWTSFVEFIRQHSHETHS